jgi:hypothetical protein
LITEVVAPLAGAVVCGCVVGGLVVTACPRVEVALWLLPDPQPATTKTDAKATAVQTETFKATRLTVDDHPDSQRNQPL